MLRHYVIPEDRVIGYIIQGENQAANSNTSHCGCNVQIWRSDKQMYYYIGDDAKRAADFLTELHEVEQMVLDINNRINALTKKWFSCSNTQYSRIQQT